MSTTNKSPKNTAAPDQAKDTSPRKNAKTVKASKGKKLMTFREIRQLQKEKAAAHVGPGSTEYLKPMGAELSKITLGGKANDKSPLMNNPGPGQYDTNDCYKLT